MRKVVLGMAITLDGFIGDLNDKWDWMVRDDTVDNESLGELLRTTDTILLGRDTYQVFVSYWPNAVAWNPALPEGQKQFASWIVDVPKIVFSTTLDRADWNNTTLVKTDVAGEINRLKQQSGKNIGVAGGLRLAQSLLRLGLIDEIALRVMPVALGKGKALFAGLEQQLNLKLLASKTYDSGILALNYAVVRQSA